MASPLVPKRPARLVDRHLDNNVDSGRQCVPNTVEVAVSIRRTVIIHHDVDPFHINPPTKNIGSDENTLLECFEGRVALDTIDGDENIIITLIGYVPFLLSQTRVNADTWEIARDKKLV